jgi:hypothetical protein
MVYAARERTSTVHADNPGFAVKVCLERQVHPDPA